MLLEDYLILRLYVDGATYLCVLKGGHSLSEDRKDMFFEVVGLHATAIILTSLILCKKASVCTDQASAKLQKQFPGLTKQ